MAMARRLPVGGVYTKKGEAEVSVARVPKCDPYYKGTFHLAVGGWWWVAEREGRWCRC